MSPDSKPTLPPLPLDTESVRGGETERKAHDAVATPIVLTATYAFRDSSEIHDHFQGKIEREEYGRYGNPTVRAAERKLAAVEGAEDALCFSSGMAAITTLLLATLKSGDHVVLTADCYRRTRQFLCKILPKFGITHTLVEPGDYEGLERAIDEDKTRLILSEAPTNPYLRVVDVERLAEIRRRHRRAKLVIDATLATPVNLRPLDLGADLVMHSATKYLGGHNDILAGCIAGKGDLIAALREFRDITGSLLDANSAYLLIRGLKTLNLRVTRHNDNAMAVARFLDAHPRVTKVYYPGLEHHADHEVACRTMHGFGGMVSFLVEGDLDTCSRFIDSCRLPTIGPSMGGVESLIEQTALMSFYELSTEERLAIGIRDNLVRYSVGIESVDDLIADLAQALDRTYG